jgi:hypothetical protein
MRLRTRLLAGVAAGALLASGVALAAVNASQMHLVLTSLKLALAKMAVADAMLANPTPPASNAEVHLAPPDKLGGEGIRTITVGPGGVIAVALTPAVGVAHGSVQLVPKIVTDAQGKRGVTYACYSPDIADIASAAPACSYRPPAK